MFRARSKAMISVEAVLKKWKNKRFKSHRCSEKTAQENLEYSDAFEHGFAMFVYRNCTLAWYDA